MINFWVVILLIGLIVIGEWVLLVWIAGRYSRKRDK